MRACATCGGHSPDEARFCMHCGADLSATEPAATPAPENIPGGQESTEVEWLQVLEGSTFMLSDHRGDVMGGSIASITMSSSRSDRRDPILAGTGGIAVTGQPGLVVDFDDFELGELVPEAGAG